MFWWWRIQISAQTPPTATAVQGPAKYQAWKGASAVVISAEADDIRRVSADSSHTATAISAEGQASAASAPKPVATPLPPLKPSQTGNMWPKVAATAPTSAPSGANRPPIRAPAAPLPASSSRVAAASRLLPVRSTLVAPILPDPMSRISPSPAIRVRISPKGMEPIR